MRFIRPQIILTTCSLLNLKMNRSVIFCCTTKYKLLSVALGIWTVTFLVVQLYFMYTVLLNEFGKQSPTFNKPKVTPIEGEPVAPYVSYACKSAAHDMQEHLNLSVEPCVDFYAFACGNFMFNHTLPRYQTYVNTFGTIEERIYRQVLSIVSDPIIDSEPKAFSMAKTMFNRCINVKKIDGRGSLPLLDILYRMGGWPLMNVGNETKTNWTISTYLQNIFAEGFEADYLFTMGVDDDPIVAKITRIGLAAPSFGISANHLVDGFQNLAVAKYHDYILNVATRLGAIGNDVPNEIYELIRFEMSLAKIAAPRFDLNKVRQSYNLMPLSDIQRKYGYLEWLNFMNTSLPDVSLNESVVVLVPSYFESLGTILKEFDHRTVVNYIIWRLIDEAVPYLSNQDRLRSKFKSDDYNHNKQPRWMDCVQMTKKSFPVAVGAMYAQKYSSNRTNAAVSEMLDYVLHAIRRTILGFHWMTPNDKTIALNKIQSIQFTIGHSAELLNHSNIDLYYHNLNIQNLSFIATYIEINKFDRVLQFARLGQPPSMQEHWLHFADTAIANAFYIPNLNSIFIPVGVLQHDLFSIGRPSSLNYGRLATVIGHEVWHAIDRLGAQFDSNGKMNEWWSNDSKKGYLKATSCFKDQFINFTHPKTGQALIGSQFAGENIADYIGQSIAYGAYDHWLMSSNNPDLVLPYFNFTAKQLFWIAAAQNWCGVYNKDISTNQILDKDDMHAPDRYRVIGSMNHIHSFSEDFKCKIGSNMNPQTKCALM